ncbi:MAG: LPS-assembly protein LptD [Rhabdochlamydiaceae bacterium]|nr:LPS-assembly protein LptD [Rhabdochlamydiaceae bacterium]
MQTKKLFLLSLICFALPLLAEEYDVQLKNPLFSGGTISSDEGGVICGPGIRIQAQNISYTHKTENGLQIKKVHAKGDLLLEYEGKIFVGEELDYDLGSKTGIMKKGRTSTDYWFVGGDEIELLPDGSFWVTHAYLTTVESQDPWWQIHSSKIDVSDESLLRAKNIKVRFFDIPVFWLPSFKFDLKLIKDPPIRYKFVWDQILKQKITMRYELYSTETFSLFGRLDYRFKRGFGGAVETDYQSLNKITRFQTKNYIAHDKTIADQNNNKRYRFQGLTTTSWRDEQTRFHLSYDKLSDDKMPQDFKDDDFEVNTQQRTILWVSHMTQNTTSKFTLQPRINIFQSINQQLPLITTGIRPFPLGNSGVIFQNQFSAGYLNYIYATGLADELPTSRSARFESRNTLYKRFDMGPVSMTPWAGFIGLFYSNTKQDHAVGQAIGSYGFRLNSNLFRCYPTFLHKMEPYFELRGLTSPSTASFRHFIFSIDDGFAKQNLFRPGLKQTFYPSGSTLLPEATLDLYTNIFAGSTAFHRGLPKLYSTCDFRYPSWLISTDIVYNFQENVFDRTNLRSAWTINENAAFTFEFRHRSKFDWRKSDHDNYIVDIIRPIDELLHSPLSDGRNTYLSKLQFRLSPLWTAHLESHIGTGRKNDPDYYAYEVKLSVLLTGRWLMEFGYKYSPSTRQWIFPSVKLLNARF